MCIHSFTVSVQNLCFTRSKTYTRSKGAVSVYHVLFHVWVKRAYVSDRNTFVFAISDHFVFFISCVRVSEIYLRFYLSLYHLQADRRTELHRITSTVEGLSRQSHLVS